MMKQNATKPFEVLTKDSIAPNQTFWVNRLSRFTGLLCTVVAATALVACAGMGTSTTPEAQVQQRATERWKALLAADFTKAYSYSASGFKAVVKPESFPARMQSSVKWLEAEVTSVTCPEAIKCEVKVRLDYQPLLGRSVGPVSTYIDETWLKENEQWWVFLANSAAKDWKTCAARVSSPA